MNMTAKKGIVYVVDDDEAVRDSLQWLLEGKDYRVRCFESAEAFLARYDPREVACLIADIRMHGMTGLELQDKLIERHSPLPIVFITGHGDVPMAVDTMKKGALDFIQKHFDEPALVSVVERMLEHARTAFTDQQQAATREVIHHLYHAGKLVRRDSWPRPPERIRGSDDLLAAALTAQIVHGTPLEEAVYQAGHYARYALEAAYRPGMGACTPWRLPAPPEGESVPAD